MPYISLNILLNQRASLKAFSKQPTMSLSGDLLSLVLYSVVHPQPTVCGACVDFIRSNVSNCIATTTDCECDRTNAGIGQSVWDGLKE